MPSALMRIALAQLNPTSGDIHSNVAKILDAIAAAGARGADLVVTPEMAVPGYCIGDLVEDADFLAANERAIARIADAAATLTAVIGFIDHDPAARNDAGMILKYNAAAVVSRGRVLQRAHKSLLPNYRYFDDKRYFAPALARDTVDVDAPARRTRLGVSICEDMWDQYYAVKPLPELAARGAELLININASPFYPGKRQERDALIRQHVARLGKPFVYVNTAGAADNGKNIIPFDGESLVYDAQGRLLAMGKQFAEDLVIVDVDTGLGDGDAASAVTLPPLARERDMYDALAMALRDYMSKTGFSRAIVALSGGIDSALALAIAADALGPDRVAAFNMPSRFNTETTRGIAAAVAGALGVRYGVIPIQDLADRIQAVFEENAHPIARGFTRENLQARIRGILMMAESNDTGALLISCGNETEIALGYATLYGDMCGGISLIGDLPKTDVYRLARHVNDRHGKAIIPEAAFTIVPSAELAANQFDPFDYPVVAPLVSEMVERRRSAAELLALFKRRALDPERFPPDAEGRTVYDKHTDETFAALLNDTAGRLRRSVYKRLQGPPIVAISERAFGFDLRETIINGWEGKVG